MSSSSTARSTSDYGNSCARRYVPARTSSSLEGREPNAEGLGGIPVRDLVTDALRLNARRIIVGEVLGDELVPMLTAMNTGGEGSLCTIHADSAGEVFARMLILAD